MWTPPGAPAKKAPAKKAPAKKVPAKKALGKRLAAEQAGSGKAAAKKVAAKKAPAKKTAAKKVPVEKVPVEKTAAKKAPAKKARARKLDPWNPEVPEHHLFVPMHALPEWAHTLLGSSTEIIEFPELVRDPMVVQITHDGSDKFRFRFLDETGSEEIFEISGSGSFFGRYSLNFLGRRGFKYLMVEATSSWIVHFGAVSEMRVLAAEVGAKIEGRGSDVIRFQAPSPMRLDFSALHTKAAINVSGYSDSHYRGFLSEIGPFEGPILTKANMVLLQIEMSAPWKNDTRWTLTVGDISGAGSS